MINAMNIKQSGNLNYQQESPNETDTLKAKIKKLEQDLNTYKELEQKLKTYTELEQKFEKYKEVETKFFDFTFEVWENSYDFFYLIKKLIEFLQTISNNDNTPEDFAQAFYFLAYTINNDNTKVNEIRTKQE
jgi:hypothetical protein